MKIDKETALALPVWLNATGENPDLVLSSRIRLARNLHKHKFTRIAGVEERLEVFRMVERAIPQCPSLAGCEVIDLEKTEELETFFWVERHLVSPDMQREKGKRGVIVSQDQTLGIMVNEEDHLRLQHLSAGFNAGAAWKRINQVDNELGELLEYAFSERWGFLTACPTNAGTGIRVSTLIHLPALVLTKTIDKVIQGISQLGLNVRGFYGEGTDVVGNLFQISNHTTLGKREEDIIETLDKVIQQIVGYERDACNTLLKDARPQIEDKVWRSHAILKGARLMNSSEFMNISSAVRLGIALEIVKDIELSTLNELMTQLQPGHLQIIHGKEMDPTERDVLRATLVRERLG